MVEIRASPNKDGRTEIKYTTDGSDPKNSGGIYAEPFEVHKGNQVVLAIAMRDNIASELLNIPIVWDKTGIEKPIDPDRPLIWSHRHEFHTTLESYGFLEQLKVGSVSVSGIKVSVTGNRWAELNLHEKIQLSPDALREAADAVRKLTNEGQLGVEVSALHFERGQGFLDWINKLKVTYQDAEVKQ